MVERDEAAEDGLFPDGEPDAVAELQREGRFLVGEAELLRLGPGLHDVRGGDPGPDQVNGGVQVVAAPRVGVDHGRRRAADGEGAVVAGPVAVVAVQDVEVRRVARAQRAIGVDVRVGAAPLPRDGVDAFDVLRAEVVEDLGHEADALVLAHARLHRPVEFVVGGVHHHAGRVEQGDLVLGLDQPGLLHHLLAVDDLEARGLEGEQHRQLDDVDADRLPVEAPGLQFPFDLLRDVLRPPGVGGHRAPEGGDAGRSAPVQPRAVDLMVPRRRSKVPHDRLGVPGEQGEAHQLVHRPGPDVGGRDVADVVHVEAEQGAQPRPRQFPLGPLEALFPEPIVVDPLLPIDAHEAKRFQSHVTPS